MTGDQKTLNVYNDQAEKYAALSLEPGQSKILDTFIAALPAGARVLDYGCGPGHSAAAMIRAGLNVDAFDASAEMVRYASENHNLTAELKSFDDFAANAIYHGIWASFSLLHAPKSEFPKHLMAIHRALFPAGILTIAMKLGQGESRDRIGRYYAYYGQAELCEHLKVAGFSIVDQFLGESTGLSGESARHIVINARA